MKNIKRTMTGALACLLLVFQCLPVFAADTVTVKLVPDPVEEGEDYLSMTYDLRGGAAFTSGKMTITYDTQYLEYSDHDLGTLLASMMSNVRDPYQDSGKEGEIVIAFSSDQPVKANDTLLDLYFDLKENAKQGDKYTVNIRVDELYNGSTKVESTVTESPIVVGAVTEDHEEEEEDTEEESQTQPQTQAQTQKQTQAQTQSTTAATKATETTAKGANAKTSDTTRVLPYAAGGFLALMILGGLALSRKKQRIE